MVGLIILFVITALIAWTLAVRYTWLYLSERNKLLSTLGISNHNKSNGSYFTRLKILVFKAGIKFAPVGRRFIFLVKETDLARKLALSGNPYQLDEASFLGICFLLGVAGLILGNLLVLLGFPMGSLLQFVFMAGGFLGPLIWLRKAVHKRQETIGLALPNYLDVISVTLQAGVPMESAMSYITMQTDGPLGEELRILQREIELGISREEAYNRLAKRNECPPLETLVYSLNQGSKLGVPVATTFKVLAEDMRIGRINKLKEKAGKAAPQVTLITSFVILPAVLMGIFGLLVLNLIYNPQGLGLNGLMFN